MNISFLELELKRNYAVAGLLPLCSIFHEIIKLTIMGQFLQNIFFLNMETAYFILILVILCGKITKSRKNLQNSCVHDNIESHNVGWVYKQ